MSDSDRLDRIEGALLRITEATIAGFAGVTQMMQVLNDQVIEVLGRLRIIGEQLARHTHPEEG